MKDIFELKEEYDKIEPSDNMNMIRFYERNIDSIKNININKGQEHYNVKLRLDCEYGLSLVNKGHYSKGVRFLEDAIQMFEKSANLDYEKLNEISYFESLLWNYGYALYQIKDYSKSFEVFKRLTSYYPKNDRYKAWLHELKLKRTAKILRLIWVLVVIWLVGEYTIFDKLNSQTQSVTNFFGIVILLLVIGTELYIYIEKRKKRHTTQS